MILIDKKQNERKRRCDACSTINKEHYHLQFGHDNTKHLFLLRLCEGCVYDLEHKLIDIFKGHNKKKMSKLIANEMMYNQFKIKRKDFIKVGKDVN